MAEWVLVFVGILGGIVLVGGVVGLIRQWHPDTTGEEAALAHSQRAAFIRVTASTLAAVIVYAGAVVLHIDSPQWQGISFVLGPTVATAVGLTVFALMPPAPLEGKVEQRIASLDRRDASTLAPALLRRTFSSSAAVAVLAAATFGALSAPAPDGRYICAALFPAPCIAGGAFLFPGWFFGVPAILATLALVAAVTFAVRGVILVPGASWSTLVEADRVLRENSARLILCIGIAPLQLMIGMLALAAGFPLLNAPGLETGLSDGVAQALSQVGVALLLVGVGAILSGIGFTVAALVRAITVGAVTRVHRRSAGTIAVEEAA